MASSISLCLRSCHTYPKSRIISLDILYCKAEGRHAPRVSSCRLYSRFFAVNVGISCCKATSSRSICLAPAASARLESDHLLDRLRQLFGLPAHVNLLTAAVCSVPDPEYLAGYQKWVEQFGVRTVVLPAEGDADDVFSKRWPLPSSPGSNSTDRWARLNGMLIPGGGGNVSALARGLLLRAVKANSEGEYWPVWGTCLGFEWIVQVFGGDAALQSGFDAVDERMDISLTQVSERRRMLAFANISVLRWLTHDNVTYE
ncbi:unnamed protein product, partial [Prorocentrum cordatum]